LGLSGRLYWLLLRDILKFTLLEPEINLRNLLQNKIQNDNFTILFEGCFTHGKFYLDPLLKQEKKILLKNLDDNIEIGEVILFSQSEVKFFLEEQYDLKVIEEFHITGLYEIVSKKN